MCRLSMGKSMGRETYSKERFKDRELGKGYELDRSSGRFNMKKHHTSISLLILVGLVFTLTLSLCSASLGTFKQDDCVPIVTVLNTSAVTISTLLSPTPNSTILLTSVVMTKSGNAFNYTFCNTNKLGTYSYGYIDNEGNVYSNSFEVTGNGKPNASGGVIVLFVIIFLVLVGMTCWLAIYTLGHLMSLDFDLIDLAFDWGLYFVIITLYFLEQFYLGNTVIEEYLVWFMSIGGILLVLVPIIALVLSMTIGTLNKKKLSTRIPKRLFYNK